MLGPACSCLGVGPTHSYVNEDPACCLLGVNPSCNCVVLSPACSCLGVDPASSRLGIGLLAYCVGLACCCEEDKEFETASLPKVGVRVEGLGAAGLFRAEDVRSLAAFFPAASSAKNRVRGSHCWSQRLTNLARASHLVVDIFKIFLTAVLHSIYIEVLQPFPQLYASGGMHR